MLHLKNICAGYGNEDVLHNITFDLPTGQNLCVLGPNGCGKSTLLRVITGFLESRGELELDGQPVSTMCRAQIASHIALMSQTSTIYFSFTVYEAVMMGRYQKMRRGFFSSPSKEDKQCVEHYLQTTGLDPLRERQISELSGGQLQRVFLARTLVQEADIILLDEPTNHLDLKYQTELITYLKQWSSETGRTVIGVLHDINLSLMLSDHLLFLKDGAVAGVGAAEDLLTQTFLQEIYEMDVVAYMREALQHWEKVPSTKSILEL